MDDAPQRKYSFRDYIEEYAMRSMVESLEENSSIKDRKQDQGLPIKYLFF